MKKKKIEKILKNKRKIEKMKEKMKEKKVN